MERYETNATGSHSLPRNESAVLTGQRILATLPAKLAGLALSYRRNTPQVEDTAQ